MSNRLNKDWLDSYLLLTENSEPPDLYRLWTGISVISSVLQRKCFVQLGVFRKTFPNLYIILVGPPAIGKGIALSQGYSFLEGIANKYSKRITVSADQCTRPALIGRMRRGKRTETDTETNTQIVHSSLTVFAEELTVFIGYNDINFLTVLINWFDCGKGTRGLWTYETIGRKDEVVEGVWVTLIGGTTPTLVQAALPAESAGSGFSSRVIFINETAKAKSIAISYVTEKELALRTTLETDLESILNLHGNFQVTKGFEKVYTQFYNDNDAHPRFNDPRMIGYNGRRSTHLLKLIMVCNASRSDDMMIEEVDFEKALDILQRSEKRMIKTFTSMGRNENIETMNAILHVIEIKKRVAKSEIMSMFVHDVGPDELEKCMSALHIMNKISVSGAGEEVWYTIRN